MHAQITVPQVPQGQRRFLPSQGKSEAHRAVCKAFSHTGACEKSGHPKEFEAFLQSCVPAKGEDDDVYKSLFSHDDPEIKRLTCPALKNIMTEFVIITERMLKDYRTGGIFHNPTEEQREEMVKCHTNNTGLERTFAHLDRDVGTGQYLDTIPMEEKRTVFKEARKAARTDRKLHQEEQMQMKQHRHELLHAWIQKQTLKKVVKEAALEALKSTVKQLGLWDSAEPIEAGLLQLVTKKSRMLALKQQITFRKEVFVLDPGVGW
ncbi:hypothetical protein Bbelb_070960 [Branchiostoma belcheri]|nr:hypothetical protein Bbelb_070960 [Branchiostoma belcheri]